MTDENRPIYASDSYAWDHCNRLAWFIFHPPVNDRVEPDRFDQLIQTLGAEHEAEILATFEQVEAAESVEHTQALISDEAPVIYQPQFFDRSKNISGTPDFLLLTDAGYQVADAKLALSIEKNRAIKTQLAVYQQISGTNLPPLVFLGDGEAVQLDQEIEVLANQFIDDMSALAKSSVMPETHFGFSKCHACVFHDHCSQDFRVRDELTLSPAIDARIAHQLKQQGLKTLAQVAAANDIAEAPYLRNADKRKRIIAQADSLKRGAVIVREPPQWPAGTMVHFDVESDPLAAGGAGEVYLWGLLSPFDDKSNFDPVWREADDFATWQSFLSKMTEYRRCYPDLLLVHYSRYERVQIQHYAARYQALDEPIVKWLLSDTGPLWDLQRFIKRYYILPVLSYGLKAICRDPRLVNFQWRLEDSGSQWSVVRYYDYVAALAEGRVTEASAIRKEILIYNEDDVLATAAVVAWLRSLP